MQQQKMKYPKMSIIAVQVLEHCAGRSHSCDVSYCVCVCRGGLLCGIKWNGFCLKLISTLISLVHVTVCVIISFWS